MEKEKDIAGYDSWRQLDHYLLIFARASLKAEGIRQIDLDKFGQNTVRGNLFFHCFDPLLGNNWASAQMYTAKSVAGFKAKINFNPSFPSIPTPSGSRFQSADNVMIGSRLPGVLVVGAHPGLMHQDVACHVGSWFGKIMFPFGSRHHVPQSCTHSRRHWKILIRHPNSPWKRFRDWFLRFYGRYASWTRLWCCDVIIIKLFIRGKSSLANLTDIHPSNDVPFRRVEILISSERAWKSSPDRNVCEERWRRMRGGDRWVWGRWEKRWWMALICKLSSWSSCSVYKFIAVKSHFFVLFIHALIRVILCRFKVCIHNYFRGFMAFCENTILYLPALITMLKTHLQRWNQFKQMVIQCMHVSAWT